MSNLEPNKRHLREMDFWLMLSYQMLQEACEVIKSCGLDAL